jgi:hypothetical protein
VSFAQASVDWVRATHGNSIDLIDPELHEIGLGQPFEIDGVAGRRHAPSPDLTSAKSAPRLGAKEYAAR